MSLALTRWNRGWYLCIELTMVWGGQCGLKLGTWYLVLVHRVDNGLGRAKWVKGKYWQTTGGKATKPGSELVNPARPWAANNPPHCKHKNLFVKELGHKIPGKSTLLNSFQEF